jgi:hypothetical protein
MNPLDNQIDTEIAPYSVEVRLPGPLDWCEEVREALADYMDGMARSDQAAGLKAMPAVGIVEPPPADDLATLELSWVEVPGASPADAFDRVREVADMVFPDLFAESAALSVLVAREDAL